jgi:hypothetical protein
MQWEICYELLDTYSMFTSLNELTLALILYIYIYIYMFVDSKTPWREAWLILLWMNVNKNWKSRSFNVRRKTLRVDELTCRRTRGLEYCSQIFLIYCVEFDMKLITSVGGFWVLKKKGTGLYYINKSWGWCYFEWFLRCKWVSVKKQNHEMEKLIWIIKYMAHVHELGWTPFESSI